MYETRTLFGRVQHRHDTDAFNYTRLNDFLKLLAMSACLCHVWCKWFIYHLSNERKDLKYYENQ